MARIGRVRRVETGGVYANGKNRKHLVDDRQKIRLRVVDCPSPSPHMTSALSFYRYGGAGLAVFALPLMLRLVPINPFYGARFEQSFRSKDAWYAINAFAGRLLLSVGLLMVAASFALQTFLQETTLRLGAVMLPPVSLLLILTVVIKRYAINYEASQDV